MTTTQNDEVYSFRCYKRYYRNLQRVDYLETCDREQSIPKFCKINTKTKNILLIMIRKEVEEQKCPFFIDPLSLTFLFLFIKSQIAGLT